MSLNSWDTCENQGLGDQSKLAETINRPWAVHRLGFTQNWVRPECRLPSSVSPLCFPGVGFILKEAHPSWQQGFTLGNLYPVGNVSVILRKRGFHSQILIQGPFQYHSPRWGNTPCTTQSPALGVRNAALYVVSMILDL